MYCNKQARNTRTNTQELGPTPSRCSSWFSLYNTGVLEKGQRRTIRGLSLPPRFVCYHCRRCRAQRRNPTLGVSIFQQSLRDADGSVGSAGTGSVLSMAASLTVSSPLWRRGRTQSVWGLATEWPCTSGELTPGSRSDCLRVLAPTRVTGPIGPSQRHSRAAQAVWVCAVQCPSVPRGHGPALTAAALAALATAVSSVFTPQVSCGMETFQPERPAPRPTRCVLLCARQPAGARSRVPHGTGDRFGWKWRRMTTPTHRNMNQSHSPTIASASRGTRLAKQRRRPRRLRSHDQPSLPTRATPRSAHLNGENCAVVRSARVSPTRGGGRPHMRKSPSSHLCHVPLRRSVTTAALESPQLFPRRCLDLTTDVSRWCKQLSHGTASGLHRRWRRAVDTYLRQKSCTLCREKCPTIKWLEGRGVDRRANNQNTVQSGPAQHEVVIL